MHALLISVAAHPAWVLCVVFLVAFAESVVVVGGLVPASIVMFTAGTLIGAHALDLWLTLGIAALGAIAGDGLSYEIGRRYGNSIKTRRIFQRHRALVDRGEKLIQRSGAKSILFARFIGPIRAVVPVLAGMAEMRRPTFYFANIGSALAWAPAHILPGVIFGASIAIAEAVSGRIAVILVLIIALLWFVSWVTRVMLRNGVPIVQHWRDHVLQWAHRRPQRSWRRLKFWVSLLLDPQRRDSQALLAWAIVFVVSGFLFLVLAKDVATQHSLVQLDHAVFNLLQMLRTTPVDRLMVGITEFGSFPVRLALAVAVAGWLVFRRCWRTARYWLVLACLSEGSVRLLVLLTGRPRPIDLYSGIQHFSFPSGHATTSLVLYSFLAYLIASRKPPRYWVPVAVITALAVAMIGVSRVYLGANWLSDVLASWALGAAALAFSIFVYTRRHVRETIHPKWLGVLSMAVALISGAWIIRTHYVTDMALYSPRSHTQAVSLEQWTQTLWAKLPTRRVELRGEDSEPLPLQWAETPSLLDQKLRASGWAPAPDWSVQTTLLWLIPGTPAAQLPVLPKYDQGKSSKLAYVLIDPQHPQSRIVLRLWRSSYYLENPRLGKQAQVPIWYGAFYDENFKEPWHLFTLGVAKNVTDEAAILKLLPANLKKVPRPTGPDTTAPRVLLALPDTFPKPTK